MCEKMTENLISKNELFQSSSLKSEFEIRPIGFVDIGSSGGPHPFIMPIASIVNVACFEPDKEEANKIKMEINDNIFAKLMVRKEAISDKKETSIFHITKGKVTSSLFEPSSQFMKRYQLDGFNIENKESVRTNTLDHVVAEIDKKYMPSAEIVKLDCQGASYNVIKGGVKTIQSQTVCIYCEVDFCQIYKGQKLFSDIDPLLRQNGFYLYGMYPKYVSSKRFDRMNYDTEERIICADAVYFKDPLSITNRKGELSKRHLYVLLTAALVLCYYDFAYELIDTFIINEYDKNLLIELVNQLALIRKLSIEENANRLISRCNSNKKNVFIHSKKFIDVNRGNNSIDFIDVD